MDSLNSSTKSKPALKINFNQTLTTRMFISLPSLRPATACF